MVLGFSSIRYFVRRDRYGTKVKKLENALEFSKFSLLSWILSRVQTSYLNIQVNSNFNEQFAKFD